MLIQNIVVPVIVERSIGISSAIFSIVYFVIAMAQLVHIVFNYYHGDRDWEAVPKVHRIYNRYEHEKFIQKLKKSHLTDLRDGLSLWFWIGVVFILFWILILPLLRV